MNLLIPVDDVVSQILRIRQTIVSTIGIFNHKMYLCSHRTRIVLTKYFIRFGNDRGPWNQLFCSKEPVKILGLCHSLPSLVRDKTLTAAFFKNNTQNKLFILQPAGMALSTLTTLVSWAPINILVKYKLLFESEPLVLRDAQQCILPESFLGFKSDMVEL